MKKQRIQFALLMAIVMMAISPQKVWALGGSGTSSSPYTIANASDLVAFANKVNGTEQGAYAKLTADITLTSAWTAMGTSSKPYTGTFDGQGHTISGFSMEGYTKVNAGFFGYVKDATIKNFTLNGTMTSSTQITGGENDCSGAVVGRAMGSSTIQDIVSNVNITLTKAQKHLGGVVGAIEGSTVVKGCTYTGKLDAGPSTDCIGGIVGFAPASCSGSIFYCFFNGTLSSSSTTPTMGGILGYTNDESNNFSGVHDCYSCGTYKFGASDYKYVNAIVGRIRNRATTTINNTYLSGTATRACNTDGPSIPASNKAITISVTAGTGGKVSQSYVNPNSTTATKLHVEATPNTGYHFTKWSDNNTSANRNDIALTANVNLTATFVQNPIITVESNNNNYGTVSGSGKYAYNSNQTISATPKAHYHFVQWNDGNTDNPRTITVTADKTYIATFAIDQHTITVEANDNKAGKVTGSGTYDYGSKQKITAIPEAGNGFVRWSDGDTNPTRTITVNGNDTYTAYFNRPIVVYSDGVLTFYCDFNTHTGKTYSLNTEKDVPGWINDGLSDKITSVVFDQSFETTLPGSCYRWFYNCINLTSIKGIEYLNTSKVTNMVGMFYNCPSLTSLDLRSFNTSKVTNMAGMFYNCSSLTSLNFRSFDTSNVTDMQSMFSTCSSLTSLDLSSFNTSKVTNMYSMFNQCSSLTSLDLSSFNTSKVTNMGRMFHMCSSLTSLDLSNFDTSLLTSMYYMFRECSSLESIIFGQKFNTDKVTEINCMFKDCSKLKSLDLSNFNTALVTNMYTLFENCSSLTSLDLRSFNTSRVTTMYGMFDGCKSLTSLNVSSFNTSNVTTMQYMFYDCSSLTSLNVSSFNTSNVKNMDSMFRLCEKLTELDLSNFNTENVEHMKNMFNMCPKLQRLVLNNFDMRAAASDCENILLYCGCKNLIMKSIPFMEYGTFNTKFRGDGVTVNYELDDNSVIYTGTNYLPAATNASYTRTMPNEWGTIVVPFEIVYNSNNGNYKLYQFEGLEATDVYFREYNDGATIEAGTPMAVKAIGSKNASGKYEVTITGAGEISTVITPTAAVDGLSMNGTYTALEDKNGVYVIDQDKFKYAEASAYVPAFSVWLTGNVPSGAKTLNIVFVDADSDDPASFTVDDVNILANLLITGAWSEEQLSRYDVDKDGKLTIADLVKIISQLNNSTNK